MNKFKLFEAAYVVIYNAIEEGYYTQADFKDPINFAEICDWLDWPWTGDWQEDKPYEDAIAEAWCVCKWAMGK